MQPYLHLRMAAAGLSAKVGRRKNCRRLIELTPVLRRLVLALFSSHLKIRAGIANLACRRPPRQAGSPPLSANSPTPASGNRKSRGFRYRADSLHGGSVSSAASQRAAHCFPPVERNTRFRLRILMVGGSASRSAWTQGMVPVAIPMASSPHYWRG